MSYGYLSSDHSYAYWYFQFVDEYHGSAITCSSWIGCFTFHHNHALKLLLFCVGIVKKPWSFQHPPPPSVERRPAFPYVNGGCNVISFPYGNFWTTYLSFACYCDAFFGTPPLKSFLVWNRVHNLFLLFEGNHIQKHIIFWPPSSRNFQNIRPSSLFVVTIIFTIRIFTKDSLIAEIHVTLLADKTKSF